MSTEVLDLKPADLVTALVTAVNEGRINPLDFAVKKKMIVSALEQAGEQLKKTIIEEVEKYGKQGATALGATVKIGETNNYNYASDPRWSELKASIAETLDLMKQQEEKIKIACKNGSLINEDTGEVIASPVPVKSTSFVTVKLNK